MSTLLVDNYDSYTYNVFHLLASVSGEEPIVIHNDVVSWRALSRWDFDAIVLSPGPGHPGRWHDFGVCADILRSSEIPVLGICLGHQGLGRVLSGLVGSAPCAMHGRLSQVHHLGSGLFEGLPQDFSVVRYHSLAVSGPIGPEGRVTAWTDDGVVMGIEHCRRPLWGVQFHPESVATEYGRAVVENFYSLARAHRPARAFPTIRSPTAPRARTPRARPPRIDGVEAPQLSVRTLTGAAPTEPLFERLFGACVHAFWLDSADAPSRLAQCSFLGTSAGPERCVLTYDVAEGRVTRHDAAGVSVEDASIFDVLDRELAARALPSPEGAARGLLCGFVGYLGYECKADCGSPNTHRSDVPDAVQLLATRVVAVDHVQGLTHLLALGRAGEAEVEWWLDEATAAVREVLAAPTVSRDIESAGTGDPVSFRCGRGRQQYLADIVRCQGELAAGESYEVCLTDQLSTAASPPPFELYRTLRRSNPAPFAAYLKLGELAVLSSSPERFLSVDRARRVQARPIKGTAPRDVDPARDDALRAELQHDEKTFAEHLMIVDLLRNDLGRVCALDSVGVPELMIVESYPTVHQMISTVTGALEPARTPVECVRACFPGGSMTGAPKLRTMGIIDDIERVARGVYSGAIGYFGLDGVVDLSIVIRTVVMRPGATTIGAGGAIVMQSDPAEEFDEILLKARAPMAAVARVVCGREGPDSFTVELEPSPAMAVAA
ncbi:MAG TPA: aminodeoxychorismate synthase component I [Solirubrobacteraceae bacterium]|jgi:para-aminobenzoate synthetase|nr:aminodeoxychorismate synthase component I [Solirubrobacteraceae bacterium]